MKAIKRLLYNQILTIRYVFGKTKHYYTGKTKSRLFILRDILTWQLREGEFNTMYYAMGLNLKCLKQRDYIGRKSFLRIKEITERKLKKKSNCSALNYVVVTKDKFYANSIFSSNGIPCISTLALVTKNGLIFPDGRKVCIDTILEFKQPFFLKNIILEAGTGNYSCKIQEGKINVQGELLSLKEFIGILGSKKWIIQKKHTSHDALRAINSSALNTTRIVTVLNRNDPEYLCGFHGFATGDSQSDSWNYGSIYVGIDIHKECLTEFGLTSVTDKRSGLLKKHPDSGIPFKDYKIPYLQQAVELCLKAHRLLYFNFIIGWDVAITNAGPLIVEANEKPGMNVAQSLNGGLRKRINERASGIN